MEIQNPFDAIFKKLVSIENQLRNLQGIKQPEAEPLLDLNEAAGLLRCSKSYIYKKTSSQEIPFQKFGKKIYFLKADLLAFRDQNQTEFEPLFV